MYTLVCNIEFNFKRLYVLSIIITFMVALLLDIKVRR